MKMICQSTGSVLNVHLHFVLTNGWELYLEKPDENNMAFGLVMGSENELGYTNINEISPYILSQCYVDEDLIFPARGWRWE